MSNSEMTIRLTENAAKHIQQQLTKRGNGVALRVGIKKSGCSGFSYTYDFADKINSHDRLFASHDVQVVVDENDLPFLNGCLIDFIQQGLNSFFKLNNPNIDSTCGCGDSFSLKDTG